MYLKLKYAIFKKTFAYQKFPFVEKQKAKVVKRQKHSGLKQ